MYFLKTAIIVLALIAVTNYPEETEEDKKNLAEIAKWCYIVDGMNDKYDWFAVG